MSSADKLLRQMRANPKGNWTIADLEVVGRSRGLAIRKSGGSHVVFSHPANPRNLTVPARRPIKPPYIRDFVAMLEELESPP